MASIAETGRPIYYWSGSAWLPISSTIGNFETIQDVAADLFTSHGLHENITVTYDDVNGRIVLSADGAVTSVNTQVGDVVLDTDDVLEANNLYFTNSRAILASASTIATASAAAVTQSNLFTTSLVNTASTASILTASAAGAASAISYTNLQISNLNTSDIEEGSNLYFTNQRAIDGTSSLITSASANALSQANTYSNSASANALSQANSYTNSASASLIAYTNSASSSLVAYTDSEINALTTSDIEEGSNLYYTEARAIASASNIFVHPNHQNVSASLVNNQIILSASGGGGGGASLIVSASAPVIASEGDGWFDNTDGSFYVYDGTFWVETASNVSVDQESAQDLVAPLLVHGNHENLTATYNDVGNKIILTVSGGGDVESVNGQTGEVTLTTTNISEGSNLYFTNVRAINAGSATYLTQANAANTYLTQANATSTYLTQSNDNTTYAPKASPIFTGNPQAPTPSTSTNSTVIATTAYVKNQNYLTTASAAANLLSQANATSTYYPKTGGTISGNVSITGDLTVSGSTTTVNTETINLADNIITLNSNATGAPTENAGIEIERGSSTNVAIRWNETNDKWEFTRDGSVYKELGSGAVVYQTTQPDTSDIEAGTLWIDSDESVGTGLDIQTLTKWYKTISASTTTITGLDDENTNLLFTPGFELIYINGALINSGLDYTLSGGDTVVLNEAAQVGDLVEIHSYESFSIADAYTKIESDNRFLSASTPYLSISSASSTYIPKTDTQLVKYGSTEPTSPATGTIWIDSTNITSPITKVYNGTTWIIASGADAGLHPFFTAGI